MEKLIGKLLTVKALSRTIYLLNRIKMLDYPKIEKYSNVFDAYYHPFKFGVSWHEKSDQDVLFVYSIVVYGQGMGFGKKLIEEIELFAKKEKCSWISFQDVINPLLHWILAKKGYSRDIEYIGDWEEDQIHWNKKISSVAL